MVTANITATNTTKNFFKMKYYLKNNEQIDAPSASVFITLLREGSIAGNTGDNETYKVFFAERFYQMYGKKIKCKFNDDEAFVRELIRLKYIIKIEQ